jgi:hypothetical protein
LIGFIGTTALRKYEARRESDDLEWLAEEKESKTV